MFPINQSVFLYKEFVTRGFLSSIIIEFIKKNIDQVSYLELVVEIASKN